jgi:phosphoserine phosphatase RsbX
MTRDLLDVGVAHLALPGEVKSGDCFHIEQSADRAFIGVIDGLGHGAEAAVAAEAACRTLANSAGQTLNQMLLSCHEQLRGTRGAAMTLLQMDMRARRLEWLGVGNIAAVLIHPEPTGALTRTELFVRGGVVGVSLPTPAVVSARIVPGDLLVAATDGVDVGFIGAVTRLEPPQRLADRLLERYRNGHDDALIVAAQIYWGAS